MRRIRPVIALIALSLVAVATGWKTVGEATETAPWAVCSAAAACCTTSCSVSCTAACTAACCATPVKSSVAAPTCGTASPRKTLAGGPVQLVQIKNSLQPVIDRFNADKDKPRVVALLSPTCGGCIHAANAIFAEAVEAYPDEDLSVLVIWEPMLGSDNEAAARDSATIFDDPRVHQFWDADRLSGITYSTEVYPERLRQIAEAMPPDHFL